MLQWWTCLHTPARSLTASSTSSPPPCDTTAKVLASTCHSHQDIFILLEDLSSPHMYNLPVWYDLYDLTMTISIWQHYGSNWLDLHFQCKSRNTMCPCVQSHVLKPYYGWGWNCSSLVLHISDSNQGVYNIYNIIIFIITVITRKDVRSYQEGESWYFWVSWGQKR